LPTGRKNAPRECAWIIDLLARDEAVSEYVPVCKLLVLKEMVGAIGFEPAASWSRTKYLNPINALSGVAYGTRSVISPLLVVRFSVLIQRDESTLINAQRFPGPT